MAKYVGKVFEIEREDFGTTYKAALKTMTIPQSESEIKSVMADGMDEASLREYYENFVEDIVKEFVLMSKLKGNSNIVSYEDHQVIKHIGKLPNEVVLEDGAEEYEYNRDYAVDNVGLLTEEREEVYLTEVVPADDC